jgi:glutamate formiminotransferase
VPACLLECVPNVSEGHDRGRIGELVSTVRATAGVRFMNVHADPDHHRAVLSFLGPPAAVEAAALALAARAVELIDLRRHQGTHPRIGALDVLPFVPLAGGSMAETVALARRVGVALGERHRLPVYFYGQAATSEARRRLPDVRGDGYAGLAARLRQAEGQPDAGPARFDERSGAILVGAREILVAFNVWLDTDDLGIARAVARLVRESSGGLPAVQALGVPLPSRGLVQVSMNLLDYRITPIPVVFDRVRHEAARLGVGVRRGELVGLAPRAAFAGRDGDSVGLDDLTPDVYLDDHIQAVLDSPNFRS